jgi:5-methylcytosine-specific restriction protein B
MVFEPRDGIFKRLCADATKTADKNFFLVIDEINRGDLPRIFGELITTLEYDKRGLTITLPITGSSFSIPKNVYIIGSMNTADRSISIMDTALRRRFAFVELMPDSSILGARSVGGLRLGAWLDALNAKLRKHMKRDARNLQIGHAYLLPSQPITSIAEFSRVLRDDIIPLLEEYCYEDFVLLSQILGDEIVDRDMARIREEMFLPNREEDLIQAISFEEMRPLIVDQEPADNDLVSLDTPGVADDDESETRSSDE